MAGGLLPTPTGSVDDLLDLHTALERVIGQPVYIITTKAGTETANTITISHQVRDRALRAIRGRYVVDWWVATASGGGPGGTQTVSITGGSIIETIAANQHYRLMTTSDGTLSMDITISGTASRWFAAYVVGQVIESAQIDWA